MKALSAICVPLLAMAGLRAAWSSAAADENVRERRNWYAADGSWCMPNCGLAAPLFDVASLEAALTVIENTR